MLKLLSRIPTKKLIGYMNTKWVPILYSTWPMI